MRTAFQVGKRPRERGAEGVWGRGEEENINRSVTTV
jgi:hypothetical protein